MIRFLCLILSTGTTIISSANFCPLNFRISERNLNGMAANAAILLRVFRDIPVVLALTFSLALGC